MESPNNRGDSAPARYLMPPSKASQFHDWLDLVYLLAKGVPWEPPNVTQTISKTIEGSPQTDCQTLLLKTTPTQHIEHGDVELGPT